LAEGAAGVSESVRSAPFRIAAAQYDISFLERWPAYERKLERWFEDAARCGARFLVFPEYFSMELASLFEESVYSSLSRQLEAMQAVLPDFLALFTRLATLHRVYVVAGTFPVRHDDGTYRNRSFFFRPNGTREMQDKLQMTRFENERWIIAAGDRALAFETEFGIVGIDVCYDVEFPLIARAQVELGASLIIVPSCTDTRAGYHRVRIGAQARALENQCYVVHSSTVGRAPWSEAVDINVGAAAVYTPVDYGFPDDGVLASGELDVPGWIYADIDLANVARVRDEGQVYNHRDWRGQLRFR
jgi:predicted amidohydrolase